MHILCIHSEDVDGWLAPPNQSILPAYVGFLKEIQGLSSHTGYHRIQVVLNSGKSPMWLSERAKLFGGRYAIACNGSAWCDLDEGDVKVYGPHSDALFRIREFLGIPADAEGVVTLTGLTGSPQAAIEEGKRTKSGEDIVLTVFPELEPVKHRWTFREGVDRHGLKRVIDEFIRREGLQAFVLEPHKDGALDVVRTIDNQPITKATLPQMLRGAFKEGYSLKIVHGGDASNDLPAMRAEGVTAITASDCPIERDVRSLGGIIADRSALHGGVIECYKRLAEDGFYGPLSGRVEAICRNYLRIFDSRLIT